MDDKHLDISINENLRLAIIRFYVWLYDLAGNIPDKIEDLLYQFHKAPEYDIRTGESPKEKE